MPGARSLHAVVMRSRRDCYHIELVTQEELTDRVRIYHYYEL